MKKSLKQILLATVVLGGLAASGSAIAQSVNFDAPVVTSPTQAPNTWYTDRYAPNTFSSQAAYGGHATTLAVGIAAADLQGDGFYNTQGRKFDFAPGATSMSIELFIDSAFGTGPDRRIAGFWGTAVDGTAAVSAYPIIELARLGGALVFKGWDNAVGFTTMGTPTGLVTGTWQTLNIELLTGTDQFKYTVGDLTMLSGAFGSTSISNTILEAHNTGQDYSVHWDTLNASAAGAVPEPATWAMMIIGFGGIGTAMRRRRGQGTLAAA